MRKTLTVLLLFTFIFSISGCFKENSLVEGDENKEDNIEEIEDEEGEEIMNDNDNNNKMVFLNQTDTINSDKLWSNSKVRDNLILQDSLIKLDDIDYNGTLETNDFFIFSFIELVPTWNIVIDDSSTVSVFVAIGNNLGYSEYYTMALWRNAYKTSLSNQEDMYGRTSIDTIISKLDDIDRIKFKIVISKSDTKTTAIKNISITTVPKDSEDNFDFSILQEKSIIIQPRQQLNIPAIGNLICSPTSLSMVLNYYNHSESQTKVAGYVFDQGPRIYGNWSFNASYAGGFDDLYARVEYAKNLSILMNYINADKPIVLSIGTKTKEALKGSIMAYPAGHLIVLTGFKQVDGIWYALVSDPAEYEDAKVNREYNLEELLKAWKGYMYVLQTTPF